MSIEELEKGLEALNQLGKLCPFLILKSPFTFCPMGGYYKILTDTLEKMKKEKSL